MSRLIDADKLIDSFYKFFKSYEGIWEKDKPQYWADNMAVVVDDAPTVDAEPIRHGHWIPSSHEEPITFKCSVCGLGYDDEETGCPIYYEWLYCPDCGAKMDEVEE